MNRGCAIDGDRSALITDDCVVLWEVIDFSLPLLQEGAYAAITPSHSGCNDIWQSVVAHVLGRSAS